MDTIHTSSVKPTEETFEGEYYELVPPIFRKLPPVPTDADDDGAIYETIDDNIPQKSPLLPKKFQALTTTDLEKSHQPIYSHPRTFSSVKHKIKNKELPEADIYAVSEVAFPEEDTYAVSEVALHEENLNEVSEVAIPHSPSPLPPVPSSLALIPSSIKHSKSPEPPENFTSDHENSDEELYEDLPLKSDKSDTGSNTYEFPESPEEPIKMSTHEENNSQPEDDDGYTCVDSADQVSQLLSTSKMDKNIAQCSALVGQLTRSASVGQLISQQSNSGDQNSLQLNILIQMHQMLAQMHATYQPMYFQSRSMFHEIMTEKEGLKVHETEDEDDETKDDEDDDKLHETKDNAKLHEAKDDDKLHEIKDDKDDNLANVKNRDSEDENVGGKNEDATTKVNMKKCLG